MTTLVGLFVVAFLLAISLARAAAMADQQTKGVMELAAANKMTDGRKKLRIISDGTPQGTHVYDEDGREIKNVARIELVITPSESIAFITIVAIWPEVEAVAPARYETANSGQPSDDAV